jgi:hypothetical protein
VEAFFDLLPWAPRVSVPQVEDLLAYPLRRRDSLQSSQSLSGALAEPSLVCYDSLVSWWGGVKRKPALAGT